MTDEQLLHIYLKGFMDEFNDTYSEKEYIGIELRAYKLGSEHATLSESNPLDNFEIIKYIRNENK